jgi:hypothetical protein
MNQNLRLSRVQPASTRLTEGLVPESGGNPGQAGDQIGNR